MTRCIMFLSTGGASEPFAASEPEERMRKALAGTFLFLGLGIAQCAYCDSESAAQQQQQQMQQQQQEAAQAAASCSMVTTTNYGNGCYVYYFANGSGQQRVWIV